MEIISTRLPGEALAELGKSPAAALVVNIQNTQAMTEKYGLLGELPYNAPLVTCWLPGKEEAARKLGVVDYVIKPVTREYLIAAMSKLGDEVKTILIVDDQAEAIQLMARMLSAEGRSYKILRAMNGMEALDIMRTRKPDAVLLDLIMPDMDGYQVLQEKEKDPALSKIAVIVVSSLDPGGGAIVANSLTVSRSNGISALELTGCIQAVSQILSPFSRQVNFSADSVGSAKPDPEQKGILPG